jgi:hypothetical protein
MENCVNDPDIPNDNFVLLLVFILYEKAELIPVLLEGPEASLKTCAPIPVLSPRNVWYIKFWVTGASSIPTHCLLKLIDRGE